MSNGEGGEGRQAGDPSPPPADLPYALNFEPLLICITAGYVCTNESRNRHRFIGVLQAAGPYVFLPFFTLTGASLNLSVMLQVRPPSLPPPPHSNVPLPCLARPDPLLAAWRRVQAIGFAVIVALCRATCIFVGSYAGGWLSGQAPAHSLYMWMTLLTQVRAARPPTLLLLTCLLIHPFYPSRWMLQAGVSLGLASEVGAAFPGWGREFQTNVIAVVLINQLLGPVLFKIAIRRVGEAGKGAAESARDKDSAVPVALVLGAGPEALSVSTRLLQEHWRVVLIAADPAAAEAAVAAVGQYGAASRAAAAARLQGGGSGVQAAVAAAAAAGGKALLGAAETVVAIATAQGGAAAPGGHGGRPPLSSQGELGEAAAAPAAAAHGHGGHGEEEEEAPLESGFSARALLTAEEAAAAGGNPFSDAHVAAAIAADSGSGGGSDGRFAELLARVTTEEGLVAVAACLPCDAANFAALAAVDAAIAGAPRASKLHLVRLLAPVAHPAWAPLLGAVGATPLHGPAAATLVASRLLTTPLSRGGGKPVALLPPQPTASALTEAVLGAVGDSGLQVRHSLDDGEQEGVAHYAPTVPPLSSGDALAG